MATFILKNKAIKNVYKTANQVKFVVIEEIKLKRKITFSKKVADDDLKIVKINLKFGSQVEKIIKTKLKARERKI